MLREYQNFASFLITNNYLREDELKNMGARAKASKSAKAQQLSDEQQQGFRYFLQSEGMQARVAAAQKRDANRVVLESGLRAGA